MGAGVDAGTCVAVKKDERRSPSSGSAVFCSARKQPSASRHDRSAPHAAVRATKHLLRRAADGDLSTAIALEATAQAQALTGDEFPDLHRRWRATRTAD
jgi:enoyl-CoA hydratase/carnithine racemase